MQKFVLRTFFLILIALFVVGFSTGPLIDDNKGDGDINYTWSANKIYDQLALKQGLDAELTALAGLTSAANTIPYFTGSGTAGIISSSANMISLLGSADYATARTNLSLVPGTDVQAYSATLLSLAGLTETNGGIPYGTADNAYAWLAAGAQGTLLMGNGAGPPSWLGAGTAGYFLIGAGAADPVWTTQPTLTSLEGLTFTNGDIIYASGADTLVVLDSGTANYVLQANGAAAPTWVELDVSKDPSPQLGGNLDLNTHEITIKDVDYLPIGYADDGTVAPAAAAAISSTNKVKGRAFDGAANEDVYFTWQVPFDFTGSSVTFSVVCWVSNGTAPANGEIVAFSLSGASIGNSDLLSTAQSGTQTSSLTADATYAQYDRLETAYSSAMTITGLAAGETVIFLLTRLATTTDTYAQDFDVAGINIKYSRALTND